MHKNVIDLTDKVFGHWQTLSFAPIPGRSKWLCRCLKCGQIQTVFTWLLTSGGSKQCKKCRIQELTKHLHARQHRKTKIYFTWKNMRNRCLSPKNADYKNYGGRGIKVCGRWLHSFKNFLEDVGEPPSGKSLDRINNDGNYEPGNCRWATRTEQNNNQRRSKK